MAAFVPPRSRRSPRRPARRRGGRFPPFPLPAAVPGSVGLAPPAGFDAAPALDAAGLDVLPALDALSALDTVGLGELPGLEELPALGATGLPAASTLSAAPALPRGFRLRRPRPPPAALSSPRGPDAACVVTAGEPLEALWDAPPGCPPPFSLSPFRPPPPLPPPPRPRRPFRRPPPSLPPPFPAPPAAPSFPLIYTPNNNNNNNNSPSHQTFTTPPLTPHPSRSRPPPPPSARAGRWVGEKRRTDGRTDGVARIYAVHHLHARNTTRLQPRGVLESIVVPMFTRIDYTGTMIVVSSMFLPCVGYIYVTGTTFVNNVSTVFTM